MSPELLANGLASLQEGKNRYVKSVHIEYTPEGQKVSARVANGVIRNRKRLTYEQVMAILDNQEVHKSKIAEEVLALILRMRDLAMLLRKRRMKRGALELQMPEARLEYDEQGRVSAAHVAKHDVSHEI